MGEEQTTEDKAIIQSASALASEVQQVSRILRRLRQRVRTLEENRTARSRIREMGAASKIHILTDQLRRETGLDRSELTLKALGLLWVVLEEEKAGHRLVFLDSDDTIVREIADFASGVKAGDE